MLRTGTRNTPALFGAGLIDAVPAKVLRDAESRTFSDFPEIKGRVKPLPPDGRLGRFGWKGQIASLDDFVRAACSNELGLEVPGQHQVSMATAKEFNPSLLKLDMDEEQCSLLTNFVARLSPPVRRPDERTLPPWGYTVFQSIGCATCHTPKLGSVTGLYSDLLLHDMGEASSDAATYYGAPIEPRSSGELADGKRACAAVGHGWTYRVADPSVVGRRQFGSVSARWPGHRSRRCHQAPPRRGRQNHNPLCSPRLKRPQVSARIPELTHRVRRTEKGDSELAPPGR